MQPIKIGIIILNYNTYGETIDCIKSIEKYNSLSKHIYIVDNNSKDDSIRYLNEQYKDSDSVSIIANCVNSGYSAGNNVGIKAAINDGCDVVFIVNSDVEILNDAFKCMSETLLSNNEYMMIGPSVLDVNGNESQLPRTKLTFKAFVFGRHPFCKFKMFSKFANRTLDVHDKDIFVFDGSVSGCCFGIRSKDIVDINYMDENVFLYSEEDILAYKMATINKKAVVDMNAKVIHKANVSTKKEGNAFVQFHRWTSVFYMLKEYAKINKTKQVLVAIWNTLTWSVISICSKQHRKMLKDFWRKNWKIVKG